MPQVVNITSFTVQQAVCEARRQLGLPTLLAKHATRVRCAHEDGLHRVEMIEGDIVEILCTPDRVRHRVNGIWLV